MESTYVSVNMAASPGASSATLYMAACLGVGELDALELCLLLAHQHRLLLNLLAELRGRRAHMSACMETLCAKYAVAHSRWSTRIPSTEAIRTLHTELHCSVIMRG